MKGQEKHPMSEDLMWARTTKWDTNKDRKGGFVAKNLPLKVSFFET